MPEREGEEGENGTTLAFHWRFNSDFVGIVGGEE